MKNINIGITVSIDKENQIVWNNGIIQNVFNLAKLLKNSSNNYNVFILNVKNVDISILPWGDDIDLKCYKYDDIKDSIDLLIMLGSQIYLDWSEYLKNRGCKIVSYHCGANYIIEMEQVIFKNEENPNPVYLNIYDETWIIPQNGNMNLHYFKSMERSKVARIIPFVWDSYFIDKIVKENSLENNGRYIPKNIPKKLSILEPNIDVVKFCMYPILIAEELYRQDKTLFNHLYVTNSDQIKLNKYFIKLMNHLDIVKDKIATFESRYITPYFLSKYTDVVISHQWENPLNYAYLDTLYLGYPLIHNAHMIKDAGYYYDGQDIEQGSLMLKYALTEHDKHIDEYNFKNKMVLKRYSTDNEYTISIYDSLIDNLFNNNQDISKNNWYKNNK